jgi:hypothetical protein
MDAVIFKMTHLQMWLQHAFGDSVACNGLGSWSSCCVYRSLSWDDAGFLALPLAMKGRAESLAALLSLTPGSFERRCASNISSTVPRCFDLGQEGNSEIWLPHMSLCPCRWYSQLRSKRCRIGLRAPPCTAAASRWCCPGQKVRISLALPGIEGWAGHGCISSQSRLVQVPARVNCFQVLLFLLGALLLVFLLRPALLALAAFATTCAASRHGVYDVGWRSNGLRTNDCGRKRVKWQQMRRKASYRNFFVTFLPSQTSQTTKIP